MQTINDNPVYAHLVRNRKLPSLATCAAIAGAMALGIIVSFLYTDAFWVTAASALASVLVFTIGPSFAGAIAGQVALDFIGTEAYQLVRISQLSDETFRRGIVLSVVSRLRLLLSLALGLALASAVMIGSDAEYFVGRGCLFGNPLVYGGQIFVFSVYFAALLFGLGLSLGIATALRVRFALLRASIIIGFTFILSTFLFFRLLPGQFNLCNATPLDALSGMGIRIGYGIVVYWLARWLYGRIAMVSPRPKTL